MWEQIFDRYEKIIEKDTTDQKAKAELVFLGKKRDELFRKRMTKDREKEIFEYWKRRNGNATIERIANIYGTSTTSVSKILTYFLKK